MSERVHVSEAGSVPDDRPRSGTRSLRRLVAMALAALVATVGAVAGPGSAAPAFAAWSTAGSYRSLFDCENAGAGGVPDRWNDFDCVWTTGNAYVLWVETTSRRDLRLYWSPERGDNHTDSSPTPGPGYSFVTTLGKVLVSQASGTVPLQLYWSPERGDNFTTTAASGGEGYLLAGTVGYAYSAPHWGTCPLRLYWSPERGDNFTTTAASGGAGYSFVGTVGHILC